DDEATPVQAQWIDTRCPNEGFDGVLVNRSGRLESVRGHAFIIPDLGVEQESSNGRLSTTQLV
ncbi:MAG: hypothetical protein ACE5E7_08265, partial [Anaerolineae bacterium]